ncbi:MAG: hemolysin family protein [Pirellula sp.]|nr:hemolysin family protein [Pirellula sp.]
MVGLEWIIVLLMVLINALFAAYEIALASVTKTRLESLKDQGRFGATAAIFMKEGIEKSFAVVQLGITIVGLIAGATSGATASENLSPILQKYGWSESTADGLSIAIFVAPLTILTIVVGELVPKLFALRNKEWVCLSLSPWMRGFSILAWPLVWLLEASATGLMNFTERLWSPKSTHESKTEAIELQELRAIASLARTSSLIGSREENIILGAARLASRTLQEIALPAEQIHALPLESTLGECLIAAHMDMHTRFPVAKIKSDPQTIIGYVTFKDIVSVMRINPREPSIAGILRSIPKLDQSLTISAALERLLREHTHIAMVSDSRGVITGMITLEDIVEELLGDIQDEYDMLPIHAVRSGQGWVAGGGISLTRLEELTGIEFDRAEMFPNLNAWVSDRLGHLPVGGDTLEHQGVRIVVRKVRRQRVLEALVTR